MKPVPMVLLHHGDVMAFVAAVAQIALKQSCPRRLPSQGLVGIQAVGLRGHQ